MSLKKTVYFLSSIIVTIGVFVYLFRNVDWVDVKELLLNADLRGVLMFVLLSLMMSLARTWRFSMLLGAGGYAPSKVAMYFVVVVRNFFSDLLPARLGSLIYVYLVTTRLGVPLAPATSSFGLAFVFDMIALGPLLMAAVMFLGAAGGQVPAWFLILGGAVILGGSMFGLWLLGPASRWISARPWLRLKFPRIHVFAEQLEVELAQIRAKGIYFRLFLLSLLVRVCKYGGLYFFLFALLSPKGYSLADLPPSGVFLGLLAPELAASLPISGIAGFGIYEGAWAFVFRLLGFPGELADLTAVSHHLFTQVWGYSIGLVALCALMLPLFGSKELLPVERTQPRWTSFAAAYAGFILLAAAGLFALYHLPV